MATGRNGTLGKLLHGLQRVRLEMRLDAAGLDLGEIENLVDQRQRIPSGGMNRLRPLPLLVAEVPVLVGGKHLGEDHHAVERCADFMRHVAQELRLVIRFLRLGFERRARLGDLPLPELELHGPILELLPPAIELHVRTLQLLQQLLGAHAGADQVDRESDGEHQLLQKGELHGRELVEGAELDDASHLILEEDRVDGDVARRGFPRPDVVST